MLDVHPPHEAPHGWRDFLLHLATITIGLLIALSLEGMVEWQHHRHLVHAAEKSLHTEIVRNADDIEDVLADLAKKQAALNHDLDVLNIVAKQHKYPDGAQVDIGSGIHILDDVSWKTAQSTGALSYVPYERAQEYASIYAAQDLLATAYEEAMRDAIAGVAAVKSTYAGEVSAVEVNDTAQKIATLQGQLELVEKIVKSLDHEYKQFLATHPE